MPIVTVNAKAVPSIAPTTSETYLGQRLVAINGMSITAAALLTPNLLPLVGNLTPPAQQYTVRIRTDGDCATKGLVVSMNVDQTIFSGAGEKNNPAGEGLKEFVEVTLFELVNASNSAGFAALDTGLKGGNISLRAFGEAKANLEAQSSMTVADILRQLAPGYVPSAWGTGHVNATNPHVGNLGAFQAVFRMAAHDATAGPTNPKSLPSWEMYALSGTMMLAGSVNPQDLSRGVRVMKGGRTIDGRKLRDVVLQNQANTLNAQNIASRVYYNAYMEACHTVSADVMTAVTWANGGNAGDWRMTDAMKVIAPDTNNMLRDKMVTAIRTKWQQVST